MRRGAPLAAPVRVALLALCAGLALLGLALGAESQKEFVLESDLAAQGELASGGAAGNLVVLTGGLVGLGVAGGALLLSRLPIWRRLGLSCALGVTVHAGVLLGQSMWPFYIAFIEDRYATLANSLIAANLPAVPSIALAPLALLTGILLAAGWLLARLLGKPRPAPTPLGLLRAQAAAAMLATPFLAILAWGNLRLLFGLPDDRPGLGPYFVVLPVATLACLGLLGLMLAKTWALGSFVRNARLAAATQEGWQMLGRAEGALLTLLGALALTGTFLQPVQLDALELGRVLGVTLRSHTQLVVLLALPLAPLLAIHRSVARALEEAPLHPATLDDGTHPIARQAVAAAIAAALLACLATFFVEDALWAWVLAVLPVGALAAARCGARASAPLGLLGAFLLWAIGNTVQATYSGAEGSAALVFRTPTGVLALWRTLGTVLAAAVLTRLARGLGDRRMAGWPVAAGAGLALAAVALLEMPLTAWLLNRPGVDAIAVGSVVASLDPPVRAIVHTVATTLAVTAAVLVALLQRPDWFARRPRKPVAAIRPKGRGQGQRATAPA